MKDVFLVNYRHSASKPMKSISQLPEEDAYKMAAQLYKNYPDRAHRRFGPDFKFYYPYRLKVEKPRESRLVSRPSFVAGPNL